MENHSEFCGCANSCNRFVTSRPWQIMKLPMILLCKGTSAPIWKDRGNAPVLRRPCFWMSFTVINVYKPPSTNLNTTVIPYFSRPCMYAGDFNCHSTTWGYRSTNASGEALEDWASASGLNLLHDPKQPDSFHSSRWNTSTNPEVAFVNLAGLLPHRTILEPFPKSQHRPLLIQPINPIEPLTAKPVLRWSFRKARWEQFTNLTDFGVDSLPDPSSSLDSAYSANCCTLPHGSLSLVDAIGSTFPLGTVNATSATMPSCLLRVV